MRKGVAIGRGIKRRGIYPSAALISRLLWTFNPGLEFLICEIKVVISRKSLILLTTKLRTSASIAELILCVTYQASHFTNIV